MKHSILVELQQVTAFLLIFGGCCSYKSDVKVMLKQSKQNKRELSAIK